MTSRTNDRAIFNPQAEASGLLTAFALAAFISAVLFVGF